MTINFDTVGAFYNLRRSILIQFLSGPDKLEIDYELFLDGAG